MGPNLGGTLSQRSLDAMDSLRRDLGSVQPSQAANSSSSKVSGSRKNKTSMQEVKGSPVESVSSSPLRFSNSYRSTSRRSFEGKDVFGDAGLFATGTPRRCSDEDDRMSNRSGTVKKDEIFVTHCGSMEPSVLDFQERDIGHLAGREAKIQFVHSPDFANCHFANGSTDTFGSDTEHPGKPHTSDQHCDEERGNGMQYHANVSHPKKSGKGSSSWSKEKNGSSKSELDKGKVKISESIDHTRYEEKSGARKNKVQEKLGVNSDKVEKNFMGKKESAGEVASENRESESQSKFGGNDGLDVRADVLSSRDQKQNLQLDHDERSSKKHLSDKTDQVEVSGRGKSHSLPPSGRGQNETVTHSLHLNPGRQKENGGNSLLIDASEGDDALKASKHTKRSENQNGNQPIRSRQPTINGHRVRDADATIPARRDSSCQAATNIVKEAKDLKHSADHLKNSGLSVESTGLYFQAALKFLHGASLLESGNGESAKQGEMIRSMQMYSSTAKLCERDFTAYAEVCFREFGDRVLYWTTVNEANIFVLGGYDIGIIPPQRCSSPFGMKCAVGNSSTEPYIAAHHILLAHSLAARLYKKKYQGKQQGFIGINVYVYWPLPYTNATEDVIAAQRAKDFLIGWFMGPLVFGDYPDIMKKNIGTRLPAFTKIESEQVKGSFDFIGVNHYITIYTKDKSSSLKMDTRDFNADMAVELINEEGDSSSGELALVPSGLLALLEYFKQNYGNPPIYIHENGQRTWKNATLSDPGRVKYIQSFIGSLLDAMRNGSNARGYFYWSFMDLFELLDGYESCYGLYYVDLKDKDLKRYPKLSAHWYSNFLKGQSMNLNGVTEVQKKINSTLSQSHSSQ